ncbi:MAG: hypothetical protein Q8T08_03550 [Ignavibacteria bacterium]|nr:hypothetical protein [Ignavibacteria bacterium]
MKSKFPNRVKYVILLLCICSVISCKNEKNRKKSLESVVENCLGKKLILPDSLIVYAPFPNCIADSMDISKASFKIYSHINASCPTCIGDIVLWDSITSDFSKYKVPIILICESKDNFELVKYLHETGGIKSFSYPLFFDRKKEYLTQNKFMNESQHFETVLTDNENNILLLGNPIRSKEMRDMYLKKIRK